jgi:hypothetical protein
MRKIICPWDPDASGSTSDEKQVCKWILNGVKV